MSKLFAIAVSAAFLVPQAAIVVRPAEGWYWPFMDYPMYSWPHPEGSVYIDYSFRVLPCDAASDPVPVGAAEVGMQYFEFTRRLERAAWLTGRQHPNQVEAARGALSHLALRHLGDGVCTGEIWVQRHHMEDGVGHVASEAELVRTWDLRAALAAWSARAAQEGP